MPRRIGTQRAERVNLRSDIAGTQPTYIPLTITGSNGPASIDLRNAHSLLSSMRACRCGTLSRARNSRRAARAAPIIRRIGTRGIQASL
jgi:hypothetical protein